MSTPDVKLFEPQTLTTDKNGNPVAIDIASHGEVIAVRSAGGHLKQFQYWVGQASMVGNPSIEWYGPYLVDEEHAGPTCSVSINNVGDIVLVWEYEKLLYYQVGKQSGSEVVWNKAVNYDKDGGAPSVAINNQGVVMAVHYSQTHTDTAHSYIGVLDASTGVINGFREHFITSASDGDIYTTSVALNNMNQAVVYLTYGPAYGVGCYYVAGTVNVSDSRFSGTQATLLVSGTTGSIGLDDFGFILEVHQPNLLSFDFEYSTGVLSSDSKKIIDHSGTAKGFSSSGDALCCGISTTPDWLVIGFMPGDGLELPCTVLGITKPGATGDKG